MILLKVLSKFPLSVILHFPPEVYLLRGVGDLCPLLVRVLHAKEISALQFLRSDRVPATVHEPAYWEELLSNDLLLEDRKILVIPAGVHVLKVYVRDLPVELSDESIKSAFSSYGEVYTVCHAYFKDFPDLRNGNHLMLMSVRNLILSSLNVLGFVCSTWHPGQPVHCTICKESGHLPLACPLGLVLALQAARLRAHECGQAGGQPPASSNSDPVPVLDDPVPGCEDDGDLSSVSSDHPDPPVPVPVLPFPSFTVEDIPRKTSYQAY